MGRMMLFWVVVIVGVPTVLWFLLSEPSRTSRMPDDDRDENPSRRTPRDGAALEEKDSNVAILHR